ncbi:fatty acid hydroxylase superfamily-domain-containing protein [Hyaloraphidium curvatum]|nr:fatty acid hydroxylase superfamily-domain-containing protein [Hyaloraphidium curvatum]
MPLQSKELVAAAPTLATKLYAAVLTRLLPLGEKWAFAGLITVYHTFLVFAPVNALLFLIDHKGWLERYRIQPAKYPPKELILQALRDVSLSHLFISPLLAGIVLYPIFKSRMVPLAESLTKYPSWKEFLTQFAAFIAIEDTLFYWSHRLLHTKYLYAKIHKQHHKFKQNVGIASEWANPIESLLGNTLPTMIGPLIMKSHPFTTMSWIAYRVLETINAHSGYDIPIIPFNWWPSGGAARHDHHHRVNVGSFGSQTVFWDAICGTDASFRESQKRKAEGKPDLDMGPVDD